MKSQIFHISQKEQTTIIIGKNNLSKLSTILEKEAYTGFFVLTNPVTQNLFGSAVNDSLQKLGKTIKTFEVAEGEDNKSFVTVKKALKVMLESGLDRKSAVIALGGGIVGDMATLIAGLYYRGVDCVQIPTTLLAQVDSSYGGKGGVNMNIYKNMLGIIKQPKYVIVDIAVLATLPPVQILSGLGEAVKYGIAHDKTFFEYLDSHTPDTVNLEKLINTCSKIKMRMVMSDPLDTGNTRIALNFGHTLGHGVERLGSMPHGLAVSVGMAFAIKLSEKTGILPAHDARKVLSLLNKYGLPTTVENIDREKVMDIMKKDKKNVGGKIRFVLLSEIGQTVVVDKIDPNLIEEVLSETIL